MIGRASESGAKATAVLAASGGLVATFAFPAQAAPAASTASSPVRAVSAAPAAVSAAPGVVAPLTVAPVALENVGVVGIEAIEKPPPPPPPPVVTRPARVAAAASRSGARTSPAAAAPAPRVAGGGVLGVAAAYTGIMYRYGGTTPAGFDCSGYVQFVFAQVGISLPRTATAQAGVTTRVSDPQPGDLVFFPGSGGVSHVGIYAGGGMMYDSPSTGKATSLRSIWTSNVFYGRV